MRMMFRKMAPRVTETLMKAATAWGENVFDLFITIRHDPKGDLDDPDACIYWMKSIKTDNKAPLMNSGNMESEHRDTLKEMFPIISEMIADQANEWGLTSYQVFIKIYLKQGKEMNSGKSLGFKIISNKGLLPVQKVVIIN